MHPQDSEGHGTAPVLVIDDDVSLTRALARAFGDIGLDVVEASNGAEGIARVREHPPSVILVDLNMPVLDGYQFIDACPALPECRKLPIILATGTSRHATESLRRLEGKGVVLIMPKPFDLEALIAAVERLTRANRLTPHASADNE